MDTTDGNKDEIKSKIEQIRLDLEKKLAAMEASKFKEKTVEGTNEKNSIISKQTNSADKESVSNAKESTWTSDKSKATTKKIEAIPPIISAKESIDETISETTIHEPVFEISEPIESIAKVVKETPKKVIETNTTAKAVVVEPKVKEIAAKKESIPVSTVINDKLKDVKEKKPMTSVEKEESSPSLAAINSDINKEVQETEEEDSKKRGLTYLMYALGAVLLLTIGYFLLDFIKESKSLEQDKMDRIISQYKNRSYLDSIELVDANSQLLDYQNQLIIDSIANSYQLELEKKSRGKFKLNKDGSDKVNTVKNFKPVTTPVLNDNIDDLITSKPKQDQQINNSKERKSDDLNAVVENSKNSIDKTSQEIKTNIVGGDLAKNETSNNEETTKKELPPPSSNELKTEKPVIKVKKSPLYPGCERKKTELAKKRCSTAKMFKHVQRNFNTEIAQDLGLKGGLYKVRVYFVIDKNGDATVLKVRTKNKELEGEAIRVVQSLPKMVPGRADGKRVSTEYSVPIQFIIEE